MYRVIVLLIALALPTNTQAFTAQDARVCFDEGLAKVRAGVSLIELVNAHLSKRGLTARVASKLGIDPDAIPASEERRIRHAIEVYVREKIAEVQKKRSLYKGKPPNYIDPDTIVPARYIKPNNGAFELSGRFRTFAGNLEQFSLLIIPGCRVLDATWQNASLSLAIFDELR